MHARSFIHFIAFLLLICNPRSAVIANAQLTSKSADNGSLGGMDHYLNRRVQFTAVDGGQQYMLPQGSKITVLSAEGPDKLVYDGTHAGLVFMDALSTVPPPDKVADPFLCIPANHDKHLPLDVFLNMRELTKDSCLTLLRNFDRGWKKNKKGYNKDVVRNLGTTLFSCGSGKSKATFQVIMHMDARGNENALVGYQYEFSDTKTFDRECEEFIREKKNKTKGWNCSETKDGLVVEFVDTSYSVIFVKNGNTCQYQFVVKTP